MVAILDVNNLSVKTPRGSRLLRNITFSVQAGRILAITGPNGIGKTSLLDTVLDPEKHEASAVRWHVPSQERAYLPQLHNQRFHINLTLGDILAFTGSIDPQEIEAKSFGLLQPPLLYRPWNTASGGERQKTLLVRLLLKQPRILILDEPMNHLDTLSHQKVIDALFRFAHDRNSGILMVSHEQSSSSLHRADIDVMDLQQWAEPC